MADLEFGSFDELFNYYSANGSGSLTDVADLEVLAREESEVLKHLITVNLASYFLSYDPVKYERTGHLIESLKVSPVIDEGGYITFGVEFDPELALHPSLWGGEPGNMALLLDTGWSINWKRDYRIPMLSDFFAESPGDGTHYLRDAISNYNSTNAYGIVAQLYVDDQPTELG